MNSGLILHGLEFYPASVITRVILYKTSEEKST